MAPSKVCRICGENKPVDAFHRAAGARDGRRGECIICFREQRTRRYRENPELRARAAERTKAWREANPEKVAALRQRMRANGSYQRSLRRAHLKKSYGITLEDYERMLERQEGGCAVRGRAPRRDVSLHVDHDHATGFLRGLLCFPCNNSIGLMGDDPERLQRAAEYVGLKRRLDRLLDGRGPRVPQEQEDRS